MTSDRHSPDPDEITEPTPVDDAVELVSAWLDDELSADEQAGLQADPAARAERARLEAVAALVAAPVDPPPPELVDLHVQAALDASSTTGVVVGIERARSRRSWWTRPATMLGGAVAAAVLVLVGFLVTSSDPDDGSDTTAADLDIDSTDEATTGGAEDAAEAATAPGDDSVLESGGDRAPQQSEGSDGALDGTAPAEEAEAGDGGVEADDTGAAGAGPPGVFTTADEAIDDVLAAADASGIDVFAPTADLDDLQTVLGFPVLPPAERPVDCAAASPELYDPPTVVLDVTVADAPAQLAFTSVTGADSPVALVYDLTDCSLLVERPVDP